MTKNEFLQSLRVRLSELPREDVEERLGFYSEMIDDRIEEGLAEEVAVAELGNVETVARQIISEIPIVSIIKDKMRPKRRLHAWEIVLLSLGSPIWLSLLIAAFAVVISLYAVFWSLIISLWAVWVSWIACSVAGIFAGIVFGLTTNALSGIFMISQTFAALLIS
jgi:uncharacterized membrane protein